MVHQVSLFLNINQNQNQSQEEHPKQDQSLNQDESLSLNLSHSLNLNLLENPKKSLCRSLNPHQNLLICALSQNGGATANKRPMEDS